MLFVAVAVTVSSNDNFALNDSSVDSDSHHQPAAEPEAQLSWPSAAFVSWPVRPCMDFKVRSCYCQIHLHAFDV